MQRDPNACGLVYRHRIAEDAPASAGGRAAPGMLQQDLAANEKDGATNMAVGISALVLAASADLLRKGRDRQAEKGGRADKGGRDRDHQKNGGHRLQPVGRASREPRIRAA